MHSITGDSIDRRLFFVVLLFAFFFPVFQKQLGTAGAMLVNGGIIALISLFFLAKGRLVLYFSDDKEKKVYLSIALIFVFFALHIPLSMAVGAVWGGVNISGRDFFELHRPILYFLVFTLAFFTFKNRCSLAGFERLLIFVFWILVALGVNHYYGFFDDISQLYTKQINIRTRRVSAPFVNPYDYAFAMSFFIFYFFLKTIFLSPRYLVLSGVAIVMFVLPQSRSVVVGFLIGFFLVLPLSLLFFNFDVMKLRVKKGVLYFFLLFFAVLFSLVAMLPFLIENFAYLTGQFVRVLEGEGVGNSANIRLNQFLFALDKALTNPLILLLGNGPAKDEMEYVESIYNYQFYRYGLVGLALYFIYPISISCCYCLRLLKATPVTSEFYSLYFAIFVWLLTIPLMSIGNNFTEQIRLSFFYYAILAIVASAYLISRRGRGV